jgi:hypothetical protein
MAAYQSCCRLYEIIRERWRETMPEMSRHTALNTISLTFPDKVSLVITPIRLKHEKVSFRFGRIDKIISFDWNNIENKLFICTGNPHITIEPLPLAKRPFECGSSHTRIAPNALIATHLKTSHRFCEIDPHVLHIHYYPHEIDVMCQLIEAVFMCSRNRMLLMLRPRRGGVRRRAAIRTHDEHAE